MRKEDEKLLQPAPIEGGSNEALPGRREAKVIKIYGGNVAVGSNNVMNIRPNQMSELYKLDDVKKIPDDIKNFVGRDRVLDEIEDAFEVKQFVVLQGMASIGKSTVARKFANCHSMPYQNKIWMDMRDAFCSKKEGKVFEELCRHILRNLHANISVGDEVKDPCSHLDKFFRKLNNANKQTLIILDNLDEFLVIGEEGKYGGILPRAIKRLVDMAVQSGNGLIHILGTSRCKADELFFVETAKNISMDPFTPEESKTYLESFPSAISDYWEVLHKSSFGFPLMLHLFANILKDIKDESDLKVFLKHIQENPGKAPSYNLHVEKCLDTSLQTLGGDEKALAQTLSVFRGAIFLEHAKNLCSEVEIDFSHFKRLEDKGILKSTQHGYSMHPFLREILNGKVTSPMKLRYKAALTVVYIRGLLKLSNESFEKNKYASVVRKFQDRISFFDHLVSILDSYTSDEKKEYMLQFKKGIFEEHDPCSFYLSLRFLYYLVPSDNIKVILQFLLSVSNEENTRSMLQACLDELVWDVSDSQSINESLPQYENVIFMRRQLSEKVKIVCRSGSIPEGDVTVENLIKQLNRLLKNIEELENDRIKAYYSMKVYKLLGKLKLFVKNFNEATSYFKDSCNISFSTFGANFWTIDSYNYVAKSLAEGGEKNSALEWYKKGMDMAESADLINIPVISTLLWSYSDFCLSSEDLKEQAKGLLEKIVEICYNHGENSFFSKAFAALCKNFAEYYRNVATDIGNLEILDQELINLVDALFKFKNEITNRSTDNLVIKEETMEAINILVSAIKVARHRVNENKGNVTLLEQAMYNWNRNIALYCSHVMLESERKKYAVEALSLAERSKFVKECDVKYLKLLRDSNSNERDEQMILEVTFLEKTNGIMKSNKEQKAEQKEKIIKAMNHCNQNWLKMKLLTCLLDLTSSDYEDTFELINDIANIYCSEKHPQSKPTYVIYRIVQEMNFAKLSNERKLQLSNILDKFIKKLDEGSSKKDIDMKCKFMIFRITLLQQVDDSNREIKSLMQQVLDNGNKWNLSKVKEVEKEYQKYIKEHKNVFHRLWNGISDFLSYSV